MKLWKKVTIGVVAALTVALVGAGLYFYQYAVVPAPKDFLSEADASTKENDPFYEEKQWFADPNNRTEWSLKADDGLQLSAIYLPHNTRKTAILAHGYMSEAETMGAFAKLFYDLGYNVLVPDARGHGKSEGDYIGFGWPERKDYQGWIAEVLQKNGADQEIVLFGISMGGATVMMTSGEELPSNVKAIVEDCGYASATAELSYQLDQLFSLPAFPLVPVTSAVTKVRAGYFFGEADAVAQLQKNKTPMLFIHGDEDDFVPFEMLDEVYNATTAPKEKLVIKGAGHAEAYSTNPELYRKTITDFLQQYVKE